MPRRFKPGGLIECADMKMHFRRAFTFARQGGPAPCAESAQPAGRRIELRYLPFGHRISVTPECHEHGDRRTAMPATALAMAPRHPYRFTGGDKSHRAAQAAALNSVRSSCRPSLIRFLGRSRHRRQAAVSTGRPAAFHSGKPSSNRRTLKPCARKRRDGLERQNAVRSPAIGDDFLLAGQLGKSLLQLA